MRLVFLWVSVLATTLTLSTASAFGAIDLWVCDHSTQSALGLDANGAIEVSIPLPGDGFGTAVAGDGSAWIAIADAEVLVHVNASGILATVPTPGPILSLAMAADGTFWAVSSTDSVVHHLSSGGALIETVTTGAIPYGVAIDAAGRVWVSNAFGNSVTRIDTDGTTVEIPVGFYPTGIAAHGNGTIWVVEKTGVRVLDGAGQELSHQPVGVFPRGITVAVGGDVWVTDQSAHSVHRFDPDGTWLGEITVGNFPWGIAAAGDGSIAVLCRLAGEVQLYSGSGQLLGTTSVGYPHAFGDLSGVSLASAVLPEQDFDNDTVPNLVEVIAGTHPFDDTSHPAFFLRGDADASGTLDLGDVMPILSGSPHDCPASLDTNDNGAVEVTDAVLLLGYLFLDGPAPAAPFPAVGFDPTPVGDDGLPCDG
ncbi:MAG: hypothetical protein AAF488_01830 [Planctomycetota bacterium]